MKIKILPITILLLNIAFGTRVAAQEESTDTLAKLTSTVEAIQQNLEVKNRLKFSGYIQAQFQVADSMGQQSFNGGNFPSGVDKRFAIRRGRIKVQYDAALNDKGISTSQYVLQFDVTEKGLNIKDAYAKFTDPWSGWVSVTAGMQNRPFGFEIVYSSSMRESPERGRMSQIIFRNERDLGAMISLQGPKTSNWNWIKLDAGLFNGTGAPGVSGIPGTVLNGIDNVSDFDKKKDFIGHLGITRATKSEKIKYGLGVSYYDGGFRLDYDTIYIIGKDTTGATGFKLESTSGNKGKYYASRKYIGFDAQLSIDWIAGITTIRGEYVSGDQPNTSGSSVSPFSPVTQSLFKRKFNGAYFYFLQNIAQTPFQAIVKYDWYDPNTDVEKDQVGASVNNGLAKTNTTDLKYTTIGVGLAYRWDANVKLTAYYDMVKNETSKNLSTAYQTDLLDNVFTLRAQVKF